MKSIELRSSKWILILFGLSGMAALVYEVTWIRPLSLVFGNTTYAISTIIASFIFGLAIGSWVAGKYSDRIKSPFRYFGFTQLGIGFYGILLLGMFGILPEIYLNIFHMTYPHQEFFMFIQIIISMGMLLVPTSLMGATLPLLLKTYSKDFSSIGKDVGKLDASNSFGAMLGTLAAGFLLIPLLGIQNSIVLVAGINITIGIIVLITKQFFNYRNIAILGVSIILLFLFIPSYDIQVLNSGVFVHDYDPRKFKQTVFEEKIVFYKESLYSSILVLSDDSMQKLTINGKTQCSTIPSLMEGLVNLAHIPHELFEYNYDKPNNALNIGLACGVTSKALSQNLETTTLEIDPVIVEASKFFFEDIDHRLIIDDARSWLFRSNEKFDIITTEPSDPYINRSLMFSQEFFMILDSRLTENGLVSQWMPLYEMDDNDFFIFFNTFHSVFPYVYAFEMEEGDILQMILIGSKKPLKIPASDLFLFDQSSVISKETVLNTDDHPVLEFSVAKNIYGIFQDDKSTPIAITPDGTVFRR